MPFSIKDLKQCYWNVAELHSASSGLAFVNGKAGALPASCHAVDMSFLVVEKLTNLRGVASGSPVVTVSHWKYTALSTEDVNNSLRFGVIRETG
ncbi:hypothetical protein [Salinicola avicenniae]|uniref:hypothetical protein n=1 Tax=Salinicola avicenniae TaxID=2916836 RepID=UPI002072B772|nr:MULTISPECIES: hypothetical protein [unclassified Salinicola]